MDGALQIVAALHADKKDSPLFLPFAVEEIRIYRSLPDQCYVVAKELSTDLTKASDQRTL